jgi:subtilisin family serine protease
LPEVNGTAGVDDDGNGVVDDVNGAFFFVANVNIGGVLTPVLFGSPDISDTFGHGVLSAGIIGAEGNGTSGIAGVNWDTSLMILRAGTTTSLNLAAIIQSIEYAIDKNARVLNMSFGSTGESSALNAAIQEAEQNNILVVASAGNAGVTDPRFPAATNLPNIISVASTNAQGFLSTFSNFGSLVDVAAPGESVYSTLHTSNSAWGFGTGTSFAAPHVTGVAGLVISEHPDWPYEHVRDAILRRTRALRAQSRTIGAEGAGGRLAADLAVAYNPTPARPTNLTATPTVFPTTTSTGNRGVRLAWSNPAVNEDGVIVTRTIRFPNGPARVDTITLPGTNVTVWDDRQSVTATAIQTSNFTSILYRVRTFNEVAESANSVAVTVTP